MTSNQEGNLFEEKLDDPCLVEEFLDDKRKSLEQFVESKSEKVCEDIDDILPKDPFGMGVAIGLPNDPFGMDFNIGATVAAITGWIEDIEKDFGKKNYVFQNGEASEEKKADNKLFAELNFILSSSVNFEPELEEGKVVYKNSVDSDMGSGHGLYEHHYMLGGNVEELVCFGCEKYSIISDHKKGKEHLTDYNDVSGGTPADALFFALGYLGVKDLLSVERVCKSFQDAVQNDPLLWRNIQIDYPLNVKITDDALLRLTDRAKGSLHSLNLVDCLKITDSGLKRLLQTNPKLTKLSVTGCIRLSVEGVLSNLKVFKSFSMPGIKHLRIGGLCGITGEQFKEFELLMGVDKKRQCISYKPRFYRAGQLYLSLDDERAIDIEMCPRCQQVRQVYDCPADSCQQKSHTTQSCRACTFCVARCINCGCCLDNSDYEETFCLDLLCLDCWTEILNRQERVMTSPKQPHIGQQASYHFFLYG